MEDLPPRTCLPEAQFAKRPSLQPKELSSGVAINKDNSGTGHLVIFEYYLL